MCEWSSDAQIKPYSCKDKLLYLWLRQIIAAQDLLNLAHIRIFCRNIVEVLFVLFVEFILLLELIANSSPGLDKAFCSGELPFICC